MSGCPPRYHEYRNDDGSGGCCPEGFAAVKQKNGRHTCFQSSGPPISRELPASTFTEMAADMAVMPNPRFNYPVAAPVLPILLGEPIGLDGRFPRNPQPYNPWPSGPELPYGAGPGTYGNQPSGGDPCSYLPGGPIVQELCRKGTDYLSNKLGNQPSGGCPKGYEPDPSRPGQCRTTGMGKYLPGDVGAPDVVWSPVNGLYGAGRSPVLVQRNVRACPGGWVLGTDGVCYERLARNRRMHDPGTKPLLTGGDVNALNRARRLEKKIGKLHRRFGPKKARIAPHRHTVISRKK